MPRAIASLPRKEFQSRGFRVVKTPFFTLKYRKTKEQLLRVGVVAGKAAAALAAERNFLRRQAKARSKELVRPGNDVLIIFSSAAAALTRRKLQNELRAALAGIPE